MLGLGVDGMIGLGGKKDHLQTFESLQPYYEEEAYSVSDKDSRSTWAKSISQVYDVDPLTCSRCGSPMRILAVITEPEEIRNDPYNLRVFSIW